MAQPLRGVSLTLAFVVVLNWAAEQLWLVALALSLG